MFPALLDAMSNNVNAVKQSIEVNDRLRSILSVSSNLQQLTAIAAVMPPPRDWRVYEHCAAVTRLYSIYERFVEDLVSGLLGILPVLFRYADLPEGFHNAHRKGLAYVLERIEWHRYRGMNTEKMLREYHSAISGKRTYVIEPATLVRHDENLRMDVLVELFSRVGLPKTDQWLQVHPDIRHFLTDVRGGQNTVDGELSALVTYRNDAAHGNISDVLAKGELVALCSFVRALCTALYEHVDKWILERQLDRHGAKEAGVVTEEFKNNVIVAKMRRVDVGVGDFLFFMGANYCRHARIESIQVDGVNSDAVHVVGQQEIGLTTSMTVKKKARIVQYL